MMLAGGQAKSTVEKDAASGDDERPEEEEGNSQGEEQEAPAVIKLRAVFRADEGVARSMQAGRARTGRS